MTQFRDVATAALDSYLAADPVSATYLGDHRHDGELPDPSSSGAARRAKQLREHVAALADSATSDQAEAIDAEVLGTVLRAELCAVAGTADLAGRPPVRRRRLPCRGT